MEIFGGNMSGGQTGKPAKGCSLLFHADHDRIPAQTQHKPRALGYSRAAAANGKSTSGSTSCPRLAQKSISINFFIVVFIACSLDKSVKNSGSRATCGLFLFRV
jgi:hypothetical protein